jgi:acid phosphatase family membrane protein YuiD
MRNPAPFPSSQTGMLAVHDLGALLQSKGMPLSYLALVVALLLGYGVDGFFCGVEGSFDVAHPV